MASICFYNYPPELDWKRSENPKSNPGEGMFRCHGVYWMKEVCKTIFVCVRVLYFPVHLAKFISGNSNIAHCNNTVIFNKSWSVKTLKPNTEYTHNGGSGIFGQKVKGQGLWGGQWKPCWELAAGQCCCFASVCLQPTRPFGSSYFTCPSIWFLVLLWSASLRMLQY